MAVSDSIHLEAILLAAGRSRRMGGIDKRLLLVDGQAMVRRSACLYLDLGMALTVVTSGESGEVAAALAGLDFQLAINPDADRGQQTSVRAGLAATPLRAPGVIVALADQPLLTAADIRALVAAFAAAAADPTGARICVPRFAGQRGNPVIFPVAIARHLREPGAPPPRAFIDAHLDQVVWFDAANDHYTRDIDTPADAAQLLDRAVIAKSSSAGGGVSRSETEGSPGETSQLPMPPPPSALRAATSPRGRGFGVSRDSSAWFLISNRKPGS